MSMEAWEGTEAWTQERDRLWALLHADGSEDDTAVIQQLLDRRMPLPTGTFKVTGEVKGGGT